MEGPILAEFTRLNALSHRGGQQCQSGSRTERSHRPGPSGSPPHGGRGSCTARCSRPVTDELVQHERLLRSDASYAAAEHFVDDEPEIPLCSVSRALPKASTAEERERLLRRLEMCARAREESTRIMSVQFAQRDAKKNEMRRERQLHFDKLSATARDRDERWSRKLQRSPFAVDLVAENQRIDEESRVRDHVEQRRQRSLAKRNREAHDCIFKRATSQADELEQLRTEKRLLLQNEKQLKALRDVERSNARTVQIVQERRRHQQGQLPSQQLQQAGTGALVQASAGSQRESFLQTPREPLVQRVPPEAQ